MAAMLMAFALAACGGGKGTSGSGGTGGGTPTGSASVTIALQSSTGAAISPPALTGSQNAVVVVTATTATGGADAFKLVTVSGSGLTFTPASGQVLTDASGVARVQVAQTDPFASGATTITAVSASASASVDVALGAAVASVGTLTTSATTVGAYQTVQVSVPVTLSGSGAAAIQLPVAFSATCGSFDPATAVSDSTGIATSTYRNQTGATACAGTVTLTAQVGTSSATTTISAQAPSAANIQFVTASPQRIYLAGSPGTSQSIVTFKLVDSNGNAVPGQTIDLTLTLRPTGTYLGATAGTTTVSSSTDSNGQVAVAVNAGSAPGPVQVQATLRSQPSIQNVSNTLAVASGLPVQKAFSLSVEKFNIEGWRYDGETTKITIRAADRLANPVPDGTTINFVASGGQIVASCNTSGAAANGVSVCSVDLVSQAFRPSNGRITVLAWAQGEETFADAGTPTNNIYDSGETYEDLGQPFLDVNQDGVYTAGTDITVGTASGSQACVADPLVDHRTVGVISVPLTCDQVWGRALVRAQAVIIFSDSTAFATNRSTSQTTASTCSVSFTLQDFNGNPMPFGTTLAVSGITGGQLDSSTTPATVKNATFLDFGGAGSSVANAISPTSHTAIFTSCNDVGSLNFSLKVTTPKQNTTVIALP
jgi:hypothetical protein